ncbi:DUF5618 family protein [Dyadobacter sp. LHD-138]|uniref:DUF5618 family protein n=1 Tax=Dyadobacter sp. LHD-138 TaxID=3071413 RepID=UPI0027E022C8|nr:DUF5618 family protein [Dyadobacter sp. LHD-138]MDQ6480972.1 DUF5618 family protein [Dyadobacter sp. LHD-138]
MQKGFSGTMPTKRTGYQVLHLDMGYEGSPSADLAKFGVEKAEKIISWVENRLLKPER